MISQMYLNSIIKFLVVKLIQNMIRSETTQEVLFVAMVTILEKKR